MQLVVTADDYGLTPGVSAGILEAARRGIVTSTSVLVLGQAFDATVGWLADDEVDVGIHLAAVGEDPPLLSAAELPTLVDRHGRLPASWRVLLPRLVAGRVDVDDLRREFEAQLEALGLRPTHANTHQHLHLWPSVAEVVVDLAVRHGIGAVRVPSGGRVGIGPLARRLRRRVVDAGLRTTEAFEGLRHAGAQDAEELEASLRRLARHRPRTAELVVHPGTAVDPPRDRHPWGYRWADELDALCAERSAALVAELGFTLARPSALP
jgi:predicted glycoside hydrolase/deacetylase ChbG (UPF0249 family)